MPQANGQESPRLSDEERRRLSFIFLATGIGFVVLAYWLRAVFVPLFVALGLAYVLDPLVKRGLGLGCSRLCSVILVFFAFLAIGLVACWFLIGQGVHLWHRAFDEGGFISQEGVKKLLGDIASAFPRIEKFVEELKQSENLDQFTGVLDKVPLLLENLFVGFTSFLNVLSILVLVPIYLFFFMLEFPRILDWLRWHLPALHRPRLTKLAASIHEGLSAFLRGRLNIAFMKGLLTSIGLLVTGIPYSFLIGMLAGLLSIIPFLGMILGLVVSLLLVFADPGIGAATSALVGVIVTFVLVEVIEAYVLFPLILGNRVHLHPLTMIFSFLLWYAMLGVFGVLVAIPLTIIAKAFWVEFLLPPIEALANDGTQEGVESAEGSKSSEP